MLVVIITYSWLSKADEYVVLRRLLRSEGMDRIPTSSVSDGYPHDLSGTSPGQDGEWLGMPPTGYTYTMDIHRTTVIHILT